MQPALVSCSTLRDVTWLNGANCPFDQDLMVFRFPLSEGTLSVPYLRSLLQPDELSRSQRYHHEKDRYRSVCTRGMVRVLLGKYTNRDPRAIRFVTGINKKPVVQDAPGVHFNVSHSGNWVLLAIGRVSVGIDVEWVNPHFSFADLLPYSFSAQEQHYLGADAGPGRAQQSFYQLWTRKEALAKATAKGLDDDFCRIPSLDGEHRTTSEVIGQAGNWAVRSFFLAADYSAAVAYNAAVEKPVFYTVDDSVLR